MGGVKRSLPDNWGQEGPNEEEEWVEQELPKKKYLCVGSGDVEAHWLHRWYKVPYEECIMCHEDNPFEIQERYTHLIPLTVRSDGIYDIKVAKTEHLLNGEK
jgi:hypothetical protein